MYKITWKPSPNMSVGRVNPPIIAIVNHRMVGFLPGTDTWLTDPAVGISAHFGIGFRTVGGPVEITQYVDLADRAWGNGNYDPSGGWPLVKKSATGLTIYNPNNYTVSIEHEDGGPTDGVVKDVVLAASAWLQGILLSGNINAIRAAGIRCREDKIALELGSIVPGPETIIDHNRIAGTKKPECWRPYMKDTKGFPAWQPQLLDMLRRNNVAIKDTLAQLTLEISALETERNTAVTQRDTAVTNLTAETAKVTKAKAEAVNIDTALAQIKVSSDRIKAL